MTATFETQGDEIFRDWLTRLVAGQTDAVPKVLWHYTTAAGVQGVLGTHRLWATDATFLNDAVELQYGFETFTAVLREQDLAGRKSATRRFIEDLAPGGGSLLRGWLDENLSVFVTCFCEDGDLLSQWRAYGQDGGYALGFASKQPQSWVQVAPGGHNLALRRVDYDQAGQKAACGQLIEPLVAMLDRDPGDDDAQRAFARNLVNGLVEIATWSKHPAFQEEREWRIVYSRSVDPRPLPLQFRPVSGLLVPYVELDLPEPTGARAGRMPVRQVRHGPARDSARTRRGLRRLLDSSGFEDAQIEGSLAPLKV